MSKRSSAMLTRVVLVVALGLLAVWSLPKGGQLTFAGTVLTLVTVCGLVVRSGRVAWYALGASLVVVSLLIGSKDGPWDVAFTGYCNSVFEPEMPVAGDAPPGTRERCEEARRERIPIVGGLAILGLAALAASLRPRRARSASQTPTT